MLSVALTFDDGPGPATPWLLDVLAARHFPAAFFLLGKNLEKARPTAVRAAREGHRLGNHTWSHARPDAISAPELAAEIARTDELLKDIYREAGVATELPLPVRLPYGLAPNDPRLAVLAALARTHTHWTGDFHDWSDPAPDPRELAERLRAHAVAQAALGLPAVIDLHDSSRLFADRSATVEGVRLLLADPDLAPFRAA